MKISYNWLKELIQFNYTPNQLADNLTMLGLEVELIVPVKLYFSGVFVGKILEINSHPDAQKLVVCKVTTGSDTHQIVCGAKNISVGDLVPAALPGAVLASGLKITERKLRGIDSYGMLCSEVELGLAESSDGILILSHENTNTKFKLGEKLEESKLLNDTVLEVNVTPNRADALSILGIAREVSALTKNPVKLPELKFEEKGPKTIDLVKIEVTAKKLCPRYTARVVTGIQIKQAPFWIRYRLGLLGIRAINNIVDITNYVLLELGQPLHAFDSDAISGNKLIIRTAKENEKILTLDNESRKLDKNTLVIADKENPVALAGVMGGKNTEVSEKTKNIVLESAYFDPATTRKTSKKLGLISESSYRFERGIDPELPPKASDRAVKLILQLAGGVASKKIIDIKNNLPKAKPIDISPSYCSRILGIDIPKTIITSLLQKLGCKVTKKGNSMKVTPPSWRGDITDKIDLTEEVARLYGYKKIPTSMPDALVKGVKKTKLQKLLEKLYVILPSMGLSEIITYSFIDPSDLDILGMRQNKYVKMTNPLDQNVCIMRTSLVPRLIKTLAYNLSNSNNSIHVFEFGRCFFANNDSSAPSEELHLSIGITGPKQSKIHWGKTDYQTDFFYLKGIIEEVFNRLFITDYKLPKIEVKALHPNLSCKITVGNTEIGFFGQLHPQLLKNQSLRRFDIPKKTTKFFIAELNITKLAQLTPKPPKFTQVPKFPAIRRDISIILDKKTEGHGIIKLIKDTGSELIESVSIFDLYEGDSIPNGKKSVAYAVIYRHKEKTLTDEEVDNIHNMLRSKILEKFTGEIRE